MELNSRSNKRVEMATEKESCLWNIRINQYSKETSSFLKALIDESKLANRYRCDIREQIAKGEPLPVEFKEAKISDRPRPKKPNKSKAFNGLRSREAIIASGAYDLPKYHPVKDFKNRDQEKNRLVSIFAFGEDLSKKKFKDKEETPAPKLSRFDELLNELQDRQSFLEEMRSLGKASTYEAQIQSEISQIIREMEEIDKRESEKLSTTQTRYSK